MLSRLIQNLQNRHYRKKNGLGIAEGLRCCRELISGKKELVREIFCTREFMESSHGVEFRSLSVPVQIMVPREYELLAETETSQGILAVFQIPEATLPVSAGKPLTLILDRLADPGNLGTILRTAWAVGLQDVWLTKGSADPWSPKSIRAGMGAQFAVEPRMFEDLEQAVKTARSLGVARVWCTMPNQGISLFSRYFTLQNSALVIGNEANGISRPELGKAVTIPMPGHAESLNAAQAATVFLVEALRPSQP